MKNVPECLVYYGIVYLVEKPVRQGDYMHLASIKTDFGDRVPQSMIHNIVTLYEEVDRYVKLPHQMM